MVIREVQISCTELELDHRKQQTANCSQGVEIEPLHIVGVQWYGCSGKQSGSSSES